jgi:hypothetical protein
VAVSAKLPWGSSTDLMDVGGVEVINAVEVSVDRDSLESVTWVLTGQSVESNTFRSVAVIAHVARSGSSDFTRVSGVEMLSGIQVSVNWDLGDLDLDRLDSDDWSWGSNRCMSDVLSSVVVLVTVVDNMMLMMVVMVGHSFISSDNVWFFDCLSDSFGMALRFGEADQENDQKS